MSTGYRSNILQANCSSKSLVITGLLSIRKKIIVTERKERTADLFIKADKNEGLLLGIKWKKEDKTRPGRLPTGKSENTGEEHGRGVADLLEETDGPQKTERAGKRKKAR